MGERIIDDAGAVEEATWRKLLRAMKRRRKKDPTYVGSVRDLPIERRRKRWKAAKKWRTGGNARFFGLEPWTEPIGVVELSNNRSRRRRQIRDSERDYRGLNNGYGDGAMSIKLSQDRRTRRALASGWTIDKTTGGLVRIKGFRADQKRAGREAARVARQTNANMRTEAMRNWKRLPEPRPKFRDVLASVRKDRGWRGTA